MAENERDSANPGGKGKKKLRILLRTFGCQMNFRDSEIISGLLAAGGYRLTTNPDEADAIILNTCSVRQHAEDKVWSELGRYKDNKLIGVVGCMAQEHKENIFQRAPNVSFVVGPQDISRIPQILSEFLASQPKALFERKIWETDTELRPAEIYHTGFYQDKEHAYVVISEGCSNFCSYCVVPYVRGPLHNRHYKDILKEIEEAIDKGITKITLLGQNVNAYQDRELDFVGLLKLISSLTGLEEFSFITSHPKDTSEELFKVIAETDKLKKHLHLPAQSGSDRILGLMNRGYSEKFYLDLVKEYRKIVRGARLTTDIIVGFPSETEKDFQDTYNLVKAIEFEAAYIFKYSSRPNTATARMDDDVSREEKERRHRIILDLQKTISKDNAKFKS